MVKFGELPVICQGFPLPKIHAIQYITLDFDAVESIDYSNE